MTKRITARKSGSRLFHATINLAIATAGCLSDAAYADESGVSYWLPGRFSSPCPQPPAVPGWSVAEVYYHTSVSSDRCPARRHCDN
jgi:hypothetical protein